MRLDVTFRELDKKQIKVDFEHFQIVSDHAGVEYYKGDYTVTPKIENKSLRHAKSF